MNITRPPLPYALGHKAYGTALPWRLRYESPVGRHDLRQGLTQSGEQKSAREKHTSSPRDDAIISPQHVSRVLTTPDPLDPAASVDLQ
jgi:hypothetical protein